MMLAIVFFQPLEHSFVRFDDSVNSGVSVLCAVCFFFQLGNAPASDTGALRSSRSTTSTTLSYVRIPHFLFNSLNTIAMLVRQQDNDRAVRMIAGLGDLLLTYERLRESGIVPHWCINHGATTSMYFLDPEGASIAVWQAAAESKTDFLVKEPGSLSWNELMTRDPSKAMPFYKELIGWDYAAMPMEGVQQLAAFMKDFAAKNA